MYRHDVRYLRLRRTYMDSSHVNYNQLPAASLFASLSSSESMSAYGTTRHHGQQSAISTPASTTLFRRLTWEGTVPLEIRVDSKELPANSDRGLECYYIQASRVSYLPLLMPEIRRFLMDVVFDEAAGKLLKEEEWWFESEEGTLLKWLVSCTSDSCCLVYNVS